LMNLKETARGEWVFVSDRFHNTPLTDIWGLFDEALEKSGIAAEREGDGKPPLRIHDTRHTAASLLVVADEYICKIKIHAAYKPQNNGTVHAPVALILQQHC
jgi:hypothetical protein